LRRGPCLGRLRPKAVPPDSRRDPAAHPRGVAAPQFRRIPEARRANRRSL